MKKIVALSMIACFIGSFLSAQSRITLSTGGNDNAELLGFAMESTQAGTPARPVQIEQIIVCKNLESQNVNFHSAYVSGKIFNNLIISFYNTSGSGTPDHKIRLINATVSGYKQYSGAYKNSYFTNPGSGTVYEEMILSYQSMMTQEGTSAETKSDNNGRSVITQQPLKTSDNNNAVPRKDSLVNPVEGGYESVWMIVHMRNNEELQVKVNGRIIGTYTKSSDVYLDAFLRQNALNTVSFSFSPGATESDVELRGKFRADDKWNVMFNFNPKATKTESAFDLPFAGKIK